MRVHFRYLPEASPMLQILAIAFFIIFSIVLARHLWRIYAFRAWRSRNPETVQQLLLRANSGTHFDRLPRELVRKVLHMELNSRWWTAGADRELRKRARFMRVFPLRKPDPDRGLDGKRFLVPRVPCVVMQAPSTISFASKPTSLRDLLVFREWVHIVDLFSFSCVIIEGTLLKLWRDSFALILAPTCDAVCVITLSGTIEFTLALPSCPSPARVVKLVEDYLVLDEFVLDLRAQRAFSLRDVVPGVTCILAYARAGNSTLLAATPLHYLAVDLRERQLLWQVTASPLSSSPPPPLCAGTNQLFAAPECGVFVGISGDEDTDQTHIKVLSLKSGELLARHTLDKCYIRLFGHFLWLFPEYWDGQIKVDLRCPPFTPQVLPALTNVYGSMKGGRLMRTDDGAILDLTTGEMDLTRCEAVQALSDCPQFLYGPLLTSGFTQDMAFAMLSLPEPFLIPCTPGRHVAPHLMRLLDQNTGSTFICNDFVWQLKYD